MYIQLLLILYILFRKLFSNDLWYPFYNFQSELSKHSGENGSLVREDAATPSLTFSAVEDVKEPLQQKVIRTLEDGPTSRQKLLVISIWIFSALFGASTCFPDKG